MRDKPFSTWGGVYTSLHGSHMSKRVNFSYTVTVIPSCVRFLPCTSVSKEGGTQDTVLLVQLRKRACRAHSHTVGRAESVSDIAQGDTLSCDTSIARTHRSTQRFASTEQ
eukprot:7994280-Pyramimonas_sp.AAC.1